MGAVPAAAGRIHCARHVAADVLDLARTPGQAAAARHSASGNCTSGGGGFMNESLTHIFLDAFLINNFVLCVFLGMCSFLGMSGKFSTAWRMGISVMFVIVVSSVLSFAAN